MNDLHLVDYTLAAMNDRLCKCTSPTSSGSIEAERRVFSKISDKYSYLTDSPRWIPEYVNDADQALKFGSCIC